MQGEIQNLAQVGTLKYLTATIKETLRMYPPATAHPLTALEDAEVEGVKFPKDVCYL